MFRAGKKSAYLLMYLSGILQEPYWQKIGTESWLNTRMYGYICRMNSLMKRLLWVEISRPLSAKSGHSILLSIFMGYSSLRESVILHAYLSLE